MTDGEGSRYFYITNATSSDLSMVDLSTQEVIKSVKVGKRPLGVATTPDGRYALVSNFDSDSVSVVDLSTFKVVKTIQVRKAPDGIAISPDGRYVVSHPAVGSGLGSVWSIDTVGGEALQLRGGTTFAVWLAETLPDSGAATGRSCTTSGRTLPRDRTD